MGNTSLNIMNLYRVEYSVDYGGCISHRSTTLTMDYPSESMAIALLRRQGTVRDTDNVIIKRITLA